MAGIQMSKGGASAAKQGRKPAPQVPWASILPTAWRLAKQTLTSPQAYRWGALVFSALAWVGIINLVRFMWGLVAS